MSHPSGRVLCCAWAMHPVSSSFRTHSQGLIETTDAQPLLDMLLACPSLSIYPRSTTAKRVSAWTGGPRIEEGRCTYAGRSFAVSFSGCGHSNMACSAPLSPDYFLSFHSPGIGKGKRTKSKPLTISPDNPRRRYLADIPIVNLQPPSSQKKKKKKKIPPLGNLGV